MDRAIELNKRICSLVELLGGEGIPIVLERIGGDSGQKTAGLQEESEIEKMDETSQESDEYYESDDSSDDVYYESDEFSDSDESYEYEKVWTHPEELTREVVEKWLEEFQKKLKRKTSRDDLDRLILSVERMEFENDNCGHWEKVIFEDGKGKLSGRFQEGWGVSSLQKMILDKNPGFEGQIIQRSKLKEETGEWILDHSLQQKVISCGGEAIVLKETFEESQVAVRVQAFDSALFAENEELEFEIHLSEDYGIAQNKKKDNARVIPFHENVIKNFCNIEVFLSSDLEKEDCLGWITIMEKCDADLRSKLKSNELNLEERKKIAIGVIEGFDYFRKIGIFHCDQKPENVLLKNGEAKWIDFSVIMETTGRESYREMGYARRGSRIRNYNCLYAGSPAFSYGPQIGGNFGRCESRSDILILCEWKTAWTLLFKPIEEKEREIIKKELETCNAEWLSKKRKPSTEEIQNLSKIISLKNASSDFCLDDPNLTKSAAMASLKQKLTKEINFDFENVTKNVLNQRKSDLCVPISVSVLLRWTLENDLKVGDRNMKRYFTVEKIFTQLTMLIYPRSLAGFNLNPKFEEQKFQKNEIEMLLRRLKFKTYLNKSGWEIIKESTNDYSINAYFDFEQVLLHGNFVFSRPLTVTGVYLNLDSSMIFHQMVLDQIENSEFILQNTLLDHSGSQIRIPLSREFYADEEMMRDCYNSYQDFVYYGDNNEFLELVNEEFNMETGKWYLLPQAYSITLKKRSLDHIRTDHSYFEPSSKRQREEETRKISTVEIHKANSQ